MVALVPDDYQILRDCLTKFKDLYSEENGLKSQILSGQIGHADEQFYNTRYFLESEIRGTTFAHLPGRPLRLRVVFNEVQKTLEERKSPSKESLEELEKLLEGAIA